MKLLCLEAEKASLSSGLLEAHAKLEGEQTEQPTEAHQLKKKCRAYKWKAQYYSKQLSYMAQIRDKAWCFGFLWGFETCRNMALGLDPSQQAEAMTAYESAFRL
jgi:hypothetical protein